MDRAIKFRHSLNNLNIYHRLCHYSSLKKCVDEFTDNEILLGHIGVSQQRTWGRDYHCDVISNVYGFYAHDSVAKLSKPFEGWITTQRDMLYIFTLLFLINYISNVQYRYLSGVAHLPSISWHAEVIPRHLVYEPISLMYTILPRSRN